MMYQMRFLSLLSEISQDVVTNISKLFFIPFVNEIPVFFCCDMGIECQLIKSLCLIHIYFFSPKSAGVSPHLRLSQWSTSIPPIRVDIARRNTSAL